MQAAHPYFADKLPYVVAVVEIVEEPDVWLPTAPLEFDERQLRGECGERQVADAEVGVWANAAGPFSGAVLMTADR